MAEQLTTVAIKSTFRNTVTVSGFAIVFNGRDLVGDSFTPQTKFGLERSATGMPVFYDHAQRPEVSHQIGLVTLMQGREGKGLYFEAQLNRNIPFVPEVLELIEAKALGTSTGSATHLVRRDNGVITFWPIIELSLTPSPAEPRTSGLLVSG